jgi:hypothetical protein
VSDKSAAEQIDAIIQKQSDWRGIRLKQLRRIILSADVELTEEIKWRMRSRPEGIPVWSSNGIICFANILKNSVRLTFPKGARLNDPLKLFNSRLDSRTVRAIDYFQDSDVNAASEVALKTLIETAAKLNLMQ